jgi:hypothetical protein
MGELRTPGQLHRSGRAPQTAPDREPHRYPITPRAVCGIRVRQFRLRPRELPLAQADRIEMLTPKVLIVVLPRREARHLWS